MPTDLSSLPRGPTLARVHVHHVGACLFLVQQAARPCHRHRHRRTRDTVAGTLAFCGGLGQRGLAPALVRSIHCPEPAVFRVCADQGLDGRNDTAIPGC